jgi:hypothetical protein
MILSGKFSTGKVLFTFKMGPLSDKVWNQNEKNDKSGPILQEIRRKYISRLGKIEDGQMT